MTKVCSKCYKDKLSADFNGSRCITCFKLCKKEYDALYRKNNLKKILSRQKRHYRDNLTHYKEYYSSWKEQKLDQLSEYQRGYYQDNREKLLRGSRLYHVKKPEIARAANAKRRAKKLSATPAWLTEDQFNNLKDIYKNRPEGCHVDHIVPLQGKQVSGLHVPWNLQYLSAKENMKKSNKLVDVG